MPRIRSQSAAAAAAAHLAEQRDQHLAAAVGGLELQSERCRTSAVDTVVDSFASGRILRGYGHDARIFDLCFHPYSESLLVSASDDCTAGVWRRQAGGTAAGGRYMQVAAFQGHADSVMRAAWSPDGQLVASGSSDGVVCLWQPCEEALSSRHNLGAAGVRHLSSLEGHPEEVYACVFLPSSSSNGGSESSSSSGGGQPHRLVTASGESLFLWDLATQRQLQQVPLPPLPAGVGGSSDHVPERWRPGYPFGVACQPDGPLLGAACSDGRLRLWARQGGDGDILPLCTLPWNQAMGADCCFGPNGLFCAVSKDGSVIMMVMLCCQCASLRVHSVSPRFQPRAGLSLPTSMTRRLFKALSRCTLVPGPAPARRTFGKAAACSICSLRRRCSPAPCCPATPPAAAAALGIAWWRPEPTAGCILWTLPQARWQACSQRRGRSGRCCAPRSHPTAPRSRPRVRALRVLAGRQSRPPWLC
ncbi:hypothetical protein ABPG77_007541 [Micractinium sp. CCAP 211/92]